MVQARWGLRGGGIRREGGWGDSFGRLLIETLRVGEAFRRKRHRAIALMGWGEGKKIEIGLACKRLLPYNHLSENRWI